MEVKRKKQFHPFQNMSLKWSFALYVTLCILIALLLSMGLSALFSYLQNNISEYYINLYEDQIAVQADLIANGEVLQRGSITIYTEDINEKFSEMDSWLYNMYGVISVLVAPFVFVVCVLVTGVLFYLQKLKKPLTILDKASARIAKGDLDFTVEYPGRNEFGQLADSFEIMRASLHETNREKWRMMEERRRLNAAFSHDLRTPLTVLRGYCDFLQKYLPDGKVDTAKTLSTLSMMDTYIERLEGYTISMSSLQKLEEIELSPSWVDFADLCKQLNNAGNMLIENKKLTFHCRGEGRLYMDTALFSQVYENLISNAVRYAENVVEVSCSVQEGIFSVTVSDDGTGFTPQVLKKAAEPYYRGERDMADSAHFGLGLYICRLLCEKHGGALSIENSGGGKVTAGFSSLLNGKEASGL